MDIVKEVQLSFYKDEYLSRLNQYTLPDTQAQFTALPEELLSVTEGQFRIVILSEDIPVGFFLLHTTERVKEYTNNQNAMLLTALSIDYQQQGKGFAKKAMLELQKFVSLHFKRCNEIILAVNHKNIPAQNVYKNVGFKDTGRRKVGKIGEQFILELRFH